MNIIEQTNRLTRQRLVEELLGDDREGHNPNISTIPVVPQLGVALGLLFFVFGITYVGATHSLREQATQAEERIEELSVRPQKALSIGGAFDGVVLEAKAAYVWDIQNKRMLYEKNGDSRMPLASITKLMTALVAYELLEPDEKIAITLDALSVEGDSGFVDGEIFTLQDLADLTLISSSNDGAAALSARAGALISEAGDPEEIFVKAMNLRAEELGLSQTSFKNSTGLDVSPTEAGAYGSARDVALLMDYIVTTIPDAVSLTALDVSMIRNAQGAYHVAKNTNTQAGTIEGLIASKTGFTNLSGGNLAIAFNAGLNRPIVVVVLSSSYSGRFDDTEELIERARRYVSTNTQ